MTDIAINITSKHYAGTAIIENFHLHLANHTIVGLFGPSGCGKTTLLNCIAGLNCDYQGSIHFGSQQTAPHIAYVFQKPCLLPWRTVRENIELAMPVVNTELVDELLTIMQLRDVAQMYPNALSQGMQRKVSIIRAFAINPDILLMDEHSVALDAPMIRDIRQLLIRLWQQRPHTVLFVTHDFREALRLADRLIFVSTKPLRIVEDMILTTPRQQRQLDSTIETMCTQLADDYPTIRGLL